MRISMPIELLAKDVGVDLLVNELQPRKLHQWPHRLKKRVDSAVDGGSRLKNEAAASPEPRQTLFGYA